MQDFIGSVRRSLAHRSNPAPNDEGGGNRIAEKIGSFLRKSSVGLGRVSGHPDKTFTPSPPSLTQVAINEEATPIRWRKGELIGCGAFGHVYMGMNLDSGELLAVKQVLLGTNNASKENAQAHIRELEDEVKLLRNLSHPNIVRYLGTVREEETLNILLEFVPGGSISSLLGKFGSFPEAVIRMYTRQILQGLEYLHRNKIIHRDIKGANILVDNKGCIKLADFGASKQVAMLATMTAAKSMKGTPYWMAPEVILQTGHGFPADIWSVGCTIIEMATGKPPWSQQFQEVAALFHIGTTKSHPPIPDYLSSEAKIFLLKCLQKEPNLRPTASDLLQDPFVTEENLRHHQSHMESSKSFVSSSKSYMKEEQSFRTVRRSLVGYSEQFSDLKPVWNTNTSDDMCEIFDKDAFPGLPSSFNVMSEPFDEGPSNLDANRVHIRGGSHNLFEWGTEENKRITSEPAYENDEVTESKIKDFLDEKALDLKKLQTPLYEEFFNSLSTIPEAFGGNLKDECEARNANALLKNSEKPPSFKIASDRFLTATSSDNASRSNSGVANICCTDGNPVLEEIPSTQLNRWEEFLQDSQLDSPRRKKWKKELYEELDRQRELRDASDGGGGEKFSPLHRCASRKQCRSPFKSPGK
ncbi:Mitogen-activated protein kinase kinase kinase NPK1 [Platanthera zijinensis]|uniref:mitogen-activated protein kinase kinase kinase n=1 Tax=Platanthera zijinensis TaxID=2320716 RepID=A0AAP0BUL6_9ASPA